MTDPFAAAVAAALFAEASNGIPLWSTPDGGRCYGQDTPEGCSVTVTIPGGRLVTSVAGVNLDALT